MVTVIGTPLSLSTQNIEQESVSATSNIDADFGDQLATLPGVSISRNGPVTGLIQYRGLYGDRVGVSIDGVDIAEQDQTPWTRPFLMCCQSQD